jgi:hypothetical protein
MALAVIPLNLVEANAVVKRWHRHHKPALSHRFSLGVVDGGRLVGAAICGRPIARMADQRFTLEVYRVATDGTKNACSCLLGAAARSAKAMGYHKIQTHTLAEESGASLRAVGWTPSKVLRARGEQWGFREGRNADCANKDKVAWCCALGDAGCLLEPIFQTSPRLPSLFDETRGAENSAQA